MLDASRSSGRENFEKMTIYARSIIENLSIGERGTGRRTRVGLMTFSERPRLVFNLNKYATKYDVLNAFTPHYTETPGTNIGEAIRFVRTQMFTRNAGDQDQVPNVAVLLTDGKSKDEKAAWAQSVLARKANIHIVSVAIGRDVNIGELEAISSAPSDVSKNVIKAASFDQLQHHRDQLSNALCYSKC